MNHIDKIFTRVMYDHGCWRWTGSTVRGYGQVWISGRMHKVHRVVFESANGHIPDGMQIDHRCRNRACCNPEHMDVVTCAENIARGSAGCNQTVKTECPSGHPYDAENTQLRLNKDGSIRCRRCRACRHEENRRQRNHNKRGENVLLG